MKNKLAILLLFLSLGLMAQQKSENSNVVILTSKVEQFKPILLAAQNSQSDGDFQMVLYGKEVKLLKSEEMKGYIDWAKELKVNISVCQMSLDRLKIDPASIPEEISIVENAFLTSLQLQKKGYKTLTL